MGRAGRDGSEARCVAFLDDADLVRLRSLAFGSVLDLPTVRGFLGAVFTAAPDHAAAKPPTKRASGKRKARGSSDDGGSVAGEHKVDAGTPAEQASAAAGATAGTDEAPPSADSRRRFGVLPSRKMAAELDMREESMEAVLSYMEADADPCLRMLPATALSVRVCFYAATAEELAQTYPVVQVGEQLVR